MISKFDEKTSQEHRKDKALVGRSAGMPGGHSSFSLLPNRVSVPPTSQ
jgi:hypothetical protein